LTIPHPELILRYAPDLYFQKLHLRSHNLGLSNSLMRVSSVPGPSSSVGKRSRRPSSGREKLEKRRQRPPLCRSCVAMGRAPETRGARKMPQRRKMTAMSLRSIETSGSGPGNTNKSRRLQRFHRRSERTAMRVTIDHRPAKQIRRRRKRRQRKTKRKRSKRRVLPTHQTMAQCHPQSRTASVDLRGY